MANDAARPSVLVIGGGYAGISIAASLDDIADVTLVEPKDSFVFNVAALRALVSPPWVQDIFMSYDHLLRHGRILRDSIVRLEGKTVVLASGGRLHGDFVVLATGSSYPFPAKAQSVNASDDIQGFERSHDALREAHRVLILGAGAVGLELAGEIASQWPAKHVILFEPGLDILPGDYKPELRVAIRRQLEELGIDLIVGEELATSPPSEPGSLQSFSVSTRSGLSIEADVWFRAYGLAPVTNYLTGDLAALVDENGYVRVTPFMELPGHEGIFAIGDIAAGHSNGAGRASRQAEAVAANIRAGITGEGEATPVPIAPAAIILPLGPEHGSGQLPGRDGILDRETTAQIKGRDMMVDRYREKLGLLKPSATTQ